MTETKLNMVRTVEMVEENIRYLTKETLDGIKKLSPLSSDEVPAVLWEQYTRESAQLLKTIEKITWYIEYCNNLQQ